MDINELRKLTELAKTSAGGFKSGASALEETTITSELPETEVISTSKRSFLSVTNSKELNNDYKTIVIDSLTTLANKVLCSICGKMADRTEYGNVLFCSECWNKEKELQDKNTSKEATVERLESIETRSAPEIPSYLTSPALFIEAFNSIDDELMLRRLMRREFLDLPEAALRAKIAQYQKGGVIMRVCESELVKMGKEKSGAFLSKTDDNTYTKLMQPSLDIKKKAEKKQVSKEDKFYSKYRKLGISDTAISRMWEEFVKAEEE